MRKFLFIFTLASSLLMLLGIATSVVSAQTESNESTSNSNVSMPLFMPLVIQSYQSVDSPNESFDISATQRQACVICQASFRDDFTPHGIDSNWIWVDPDDDVQHTATERQGYLRLSTVSSIDNNLAPGSLAAPRLLRPLSGTTFKISTYVEITPVHDYQGAGLLIWQDENNFIRLERGFGLNGQGVYFARNNDGNLTYQFIATGVNVLWLRLQKFGRVVIAWMKDDNQTGWKVVGAVDALPVDDLQVGVILVAAFNYPPTTADFDYFAITTCSPDLPDIDEQAN